VAGLSSPFLEKMSANITLWPSCAQRRPFCCLTLWMTTRHPASLCQCLLPQGADTPAHYVVTCKRCARSIHHWSDVISQIQSGSVMPLCGELRRDSRSSGKSSLDSPTVILASSRFHHAPPCPRDPSKSLQANLAFGADLTQ